MWNLESEAEEPVTAVGTTGSHRSLCFVFNGNSLSTRVKLYTKGANLAVAHRVDAGWLEIRSPVLSGPHAEA